MRSMRPESVMAVTVLPLPLAHEPDDLAVADGQVDARQPRARRRESDVQIVDFDHGGISF